jgi:hypothetical protein
LGERADQKRARSTQAARIELHPYHALIVAQRILNAVGAALSALTVEHPKSQVDYFVALETQDGAVIDGVGISIETSAHPPKAGWAVGKALLTVDQQAYFAASTLTG